VTAAPVMNWRRFSSMTVLASPGLGVVARGTTLTSAEPDHGARVVVLLQQVDLRVVEA
jgi:hypothetical protein